MSLTARAWWPSPAPIDRRRVRCDPELQAMIRDGLLVGHPQGYVVPADLVAGAQPRARSIAPLVPSAAVVGALAAGWIHGGGPPPAEVWLAIPPADRLPAPSPHIRSYQAAYGPADVVRIGGVQVTSVHRTGLDVAQMAHADQAIAALARLIAFAGFDPAAALAEAPGGPGGPAARLLAGFLP